MFTVQSQLQIIKVMHFCTINRQKNRIWQILQLYMLATNSVEGDELRETENYK